MCIVKEKHTKYIKEKKMSIRRAVRKVVVNTEEERKRSFILEYYTLEKEIYVEGESYNTYGIEVLKREATDLGTLLHLLYKKYQKLFCTQFAKSPNPLSLALKLQCRTYCEILPLHKFPFQAYSILK